MRSMFLTVPPLEDQQADEIEQSTPSRRERRAKKRELEKKSKKYYANKASTKYAARRVAAITSGMLATIASKTSAPEAKKAASEWIQKTYGVDGNFADAMDSAIKVSEAYARGDI